MYEITIQPTTIIMKKILQLMSKKYNTQNRIKLIFNYIYACVCVCVYEYESSGCLIIIFIFIYIFYFGVINRKYVILFQTFKALYNEAELCDMLYG